MTEPQEGDKVRVKIRSDIDSERVVHKFEGSVTKVSDKDSNLGGAKSHRIQIPVGIMNVITVREYEAEFEVLE